MAVSRSSRTARPGSSAVARSLLPFRMSKDGASVSTLCLPFPHLIRASDAVACVLAASRGPGEFGKIAAQPYEDHLWHPEHPQPGDRYGEGLTRSGSYTA